MLLLLPHSPRLLMPLPRSAFAFLESPAFAALFEPPAFTAALFEASALAPALFESTAAFLDPSAFTAAFFEASALASAFLDPSALTAAFFHAPAFFHASAFTAAFFHASAFTAAFLEASAFTAALFHASAFTTALRAILAVLPVALSAPAPTTRAGLRRTLRDLRGVAGGIDRLRLHRRRDDEGRRCDYASSQCFLEHEYHSVDSVTVTGKPDTRSANRSIEPWIQTLILTLEVTKGTVTQQCANNRFPHQKTHLTQGSCRVISLRRPSLYAGRRMPSTSLRRIGCDRTRSAGAGPRPHPGDYGELPTETARVLEVAVTAVGQWGRHASLSWAAPRTRGPTLVAGREFAGHGL
ncbi:hypothetical protein [Microbispora sp. NPDC049633]|uniref:hypothetical protein n=1 Tax=Microbispora sp. NPDC049633 TaxID=3154355 RepID=UPI003438CC6C